MPLTTLVTHEDLILYDILTNPALAIEFINNYDLTELDEPFELTWYQKEFVCDFGSYESLCCARAVGKCFSETAMIENPETGEYKTVKEWYDSENLNKIIAISDSLVQKTSNLSIEYNGVHDCLTIETAKGFKTTVTYEHPMLTDKGFVEAKNLRIGDRIAVAKEIPYFGNEDLSEIEVATLAQTCEEYIPQSVFKLPKDKLSVFLNRFFSVDSRCLLRGNKIDYFTFSEKLARDLQHLLLRFGVISSVKLSKMFSKNLWELLVKGEDNIKKFKKEFSYTGKIDHTGVLNTDSKTKDVLWEEVESIAKETNVSTYAIEVNKYHTHLVDNIYSHNTEALSGLIVWILVMNLFDTYIVYFVPGKAQLDPVWTSLVKKFRSNSFLKHFLPSNSGVNASEFKITLLNSASLLCRIAGQSGTGQNVIGLHSPWICVDEAGYFPWNVFMELQPALNTFTSGFKMIVSGVPTGLREHNVLYYCDQMNSNYSKNRISALLNPRFTEKDRLVAEEQYGGEESDDYLHYVLGIHGKPVFSLFDRSTMLVEDYPVYKLALEGMQLNDNLNAYMEKLYGFPGLPEKRTKCILGIDLGYTEPTAIIILYLDQYGRLKFHGRIQLTKVSYPVQEKFINMLDTKFSPLIIGMDKGNAGMSVFQHLNEDVEYSKKEYKKRLIPIDFSSSISLGFDSDGNEIKSKAKPFTVSVLQDYTNNHKLVFTAKDLEMISELERMTYSKTTTGDIIYRTFSIRGGKEGSDHFTSALLCGIGAYYLSTEYIQVKEERKTLAQPRWFVGI
jgi:hypothetical protein